MRATAVVLLLLGGLLALPGGQAQAPGLAVLEDKTGDVQMMVAGTPAGNPTGRFAAQDLVGLTVEETADSFVLHLKVASLTSAPEAPAAESALYTVAFAHGEVAYRVLFWRQVGQDADYGGQLQVYDTGRGQYGSIERLPVTVDAPAGIMTAAVAREQILDENGAAPFPSRFLTDFRATSAGLRITGQCWPMLPCQPLPTTAVLDAMPDQGVGPINVPVVLGIGQTGYARLFADTPVRASNGEATTFVFQVNATNLDDAKHYFSLAATGVPAGWQVTIASSVVELKAQQTATLPVLVTTPFGHNHGTFQDFLLEMVSLDDGGSVGRVELGVRYMATPQPAGHHNILYLHTAAVDGDPTFNSVFGTLFGFDPQNLYFNTLTPEEDDNDAGTPVGGTSRFIWDGPGSVPTGRFTWSIPLSPPLAMGLDFDPLGTGSIRILLNSVLPLPAAVLDGRIIHNIPLEPCDPREDEGCEYNGEDDYFVGRGTRTVVALIGPSTPVEVGTNAANVAFEAPIVATPEGDYLPFQDGATLTMQLNISFQRPETPFGPRDMPKISGGSMTLPLQEYHDAVDTVFASSAGLMMHVDGSQQRQVNAGETAVFDLQLMNHGTEAATFDVSLTGPHVEWADVLGDARVTLAAGESRPLAIAVAAPASARQGDMADLVVTAANVADPTQRTLARLVVLVDETSDHPDDASRVAALDGQLSAKNVPAIPLAWAALALAVLVAARRRRLP